MRTMTYENRTVEGVDVDDSVSRWSKATEDMARELARAMSQIASGILLKRGGGTRLKGHARIEHVRTPTGWMTKPTRVAHQ